MFVKTNFLWCHPADESLQYLYIKGQSHGEEDPEELLTSLITASLNWLAQRHT